MPWRMPSSLKRFRALTMGRPMIMGRKTFESIGRPLDGRDTIVVTRNVNFKVEGVHCAANLAEALAVASRLASARGSNEIIIAGGGEIYRAALPFATDVQLDRIEAEPAGDTVFPQLDRNEWQEITSIPIPPATNDQFRATAVHYERIGRPCPLPPA